VALALVICGCDSSPAPRGEKIALKLNLKPGDKVKMTADIDMKMNVKPPGQGAQKVNMAMGFGMSFDVLDVDQEGVHTIKATYDRVRMNVSGAGQSMAYDSDNPSGASNPGLKMLGAMVGSSLTMKVTPEGKTLEVTGVDEMVEKMSEDAPPGAQANLEQQAESITQSFDQMVAALPKDPVDIRDKWTGSMQMATDPNMPMKVDATYTLYDRKDGKAIIKIDGKMTSTKGISGTMQGTMRINEETGWTEGGEMNMEMEGKVQGVEMDMQGKITFGS
jgi:hypothetical protein